MAKYRKKPVVVEAFRWTGDENQTGIPEWFVESLKSGTVRVNNDEIDIGYYDAGEPMTEVINCWLEIETLEGTMQANKGDYIIKGVQGELYPIKEDIFEKTYEKL